jgi:hypothetical protein
MTVPYMTGETMSKTAFGSKCNMLADIWINFKEREDITKDWSDLFAINDLGFPLAHLVSNGLVSINKREEAKELIEETWGDMCLALNIDKDAMYDGAIEMFKASEYYKDVDWSAIEDDE